MPVVLEAQHEETWLSGGSRDELQSVPKPYRNEELRSSFGTVRHDQCD